jgi:tetratricopeptide (TPR) repeat protein
VCLIDALIAKGRANIALANLHDARSDLLKAIRLNDEGSGNPKTAAACYLRLADSYVVERDLQRAQEWLDRWTLIEKEVEHRSLRDLAVEVRDKLEKSRGFVIPHDEKDLHYHRHAFQLQRFLWSKARDRHQTQEATAAALQVTRVTLQDWTKTFEKADDFEKELNTLSERLKRVASPNAERLQRMIKSIGGVETARTILSEMPAWYDAMLSSAIPDLLVENVMLNEHWKGLFTQRELNKAKSRLPKPEAF